MAATMRHMNTTTPIACAAADFDFLVGTWSTRQRRLKQRLQQCDEWESFDATVTMHKLPGGTANFDTMTAPAWRPGWTGMTMRLFNPVTNAWSIYWFTSDGGGIDAKTGHLEPPVVGRFVGEEGLFEGDDSFHGQPIRVRFVWTRLGANAARWQQSFSPDDGQTWEINWTMEFTRVGA
jgi:hypothetical protein